METKNSLNNVFKDQRMLIHTLTSQEAEDLEKLLLKLERGQAILRGHKILRPRRKQKSRCMIIDFEMKL
jgi:hypothetical protein